MGSDAKGGADTTATRLASGIAHQLNNILTVVGGHASVLMEDLSADHPARPSVEAISEASEAAAELTNQLLLYAGQLRQKARECVVADLMAGVEQAVAGRVAAARAGSRVQPSFSCEPHLPSVVVDPARFEEVLGHLTAFGSSNLKGSGEIAVHAEQRDPSNFGDPQVRIRVTISGPRPAPVVTDKLFEPFAASRHGELADGMRLPAAKEAVRRWGGALDAEQDDSVLTFFVTVPGAPR